MSLPRGFVVDEKFPDVTQWLIRAGWILCPHHTYPNCFLRYTNYVKIQWKYVKQNQIINHLHNAILLSKKHELLQHLNARSYISIFIPRSTTSFDEWLPMYLYSQAILVLKNWKRYSASLPAAQLVGREMQHLNTPKAAREHGLRYVRSHSNGIQPLISPAIASETCMSSRYDETPWIDEILLHLEACDPQFHFVSTRNIWIAKPGGLSRGRGIELIATKSQFESFLVDLDKDFVIQQYVERPMLLHGRKFDIRQWVLITNTAPLSIYWYSQCYLRFSAKPYSLADDDSMDDKFMHLCNNSIQKNSNLEDHPAIPENMWSHDSFLVHLSALGLRDHWEEKTLPGMKHAAIEAILSVGMKLERIGKGFEWLGLDYLLDENMTPWLLEVNVSPDVSHSTNTTAKMVPQATSDMLELVIGSTESNRGNGWHLLFQES